MGKTKKSNNSNVSDSKTRVVSATLATKRSELKGTTRHVINAKDDNELKCVWSFMRSHTWEETKHMFHPIIDFGEFRVIHWYIMKGEGGFNDACHKVKQWAWVTMKQLEFLRLHEPAAGWNGGVDAVYDEIVYWSYDELTVLENARDIGELMKKNTTMTIIQRGLTETMFDIDYNLNNNNERKDDDEEEQENDEEWMYLSDAASDDTDRLESIISKTWVTK